MLGPGFGLLFIIWVVFCQNTPFLLIPWGARVSLKRVELQ